VNNWGALGDNRWRFHQMSLQCRRTQTYSQPIFPVEHPISCGGTAVIWAYSHYEEEYLISSKINYSSKELMKKPHELGIAHEAC